MKASFNSRSIAATHEALLFVSLEDMMGKSDSESQLPARHFVLKRRPRHFSSVFLDYLLRGRLPWSSVVAAGLIAVAPGPLNRVRIGADRDSASASAAG